MKLMRIIRTIITSSLIALFLMSNGSIYANQLPQNISQTPLNDIIFEVTIEGNKYSIPTPLNASAAPVTVKIIKDGSVVFQRLANSNISVIGDNIEHRIVGDGIDHRVTGDGVDHLMRLEVSQNGIVLFDKEI